MVNVAVSCRTINNDDVLDSLESIDKEEFLKYQQIMEQQALTCFKTIENLEKRLNSLDSILNISSYLNNMTIENNIHETLADMLVGLVGVTNAFIYTVLNRELVLQAKTCDVKYHESVDYYNKYQRGLNGIAVHRYSKSVSKYEDRIVKSSLGIPIQYQNEFLGYIIVEHTNEGYFDDYWQSYIELIARQIAILMINAKLYNQLKYMAEMDSVTGVSSRRYFIEYVTNKLNITTNYGLLMIDIDKFKNVNDTFGHIAGDEVLKSTAQLLKNNIRSDDMIARYGGEEFVIYLAGISDKKILLRKAESLRKLIENNVVSFQHQNINITISIGGTTNTGIDNKFYENLSKADDFLYKAKNTGRNKSVIDNIEGGNLYDKN